MRDLLIKASWFEGLDEAPVEVINVIAGRILRIGCFEQSISAEELAKDDYSMKNIWSNLSGNIERMAEAKKQQQKYGKTHGKKMKGDPQAIYDYWQKHKGTAAQVGEALGLPPSAGAKEPYGYLYENPGWKNRKKPNWSFSNEEFQIPISNLEKNSKIETPELEKNSNLESKMESDLEKKNGGYSFSDVFNF
jgi:hypothetical protein